MHSETIPIKSSWSPSNFHHNISESPLGGRLADSSPSLEPLPLSGILFHNSLMNLHSPCWLLVCIFPLQCVITSPEATGLGWVWWQWLSGTKIWERPCCTHRFHIDMISSIPFLSYFPSHCWAHYVYLALSMLWETWHCQLCSMRTFQRVLL